MNYRGLNVNSRVNFSYKCDYCSGKVNRNTVERVNKMNTLKQQASLLNQQNQKAYAILEKTSLNPSHYCRLVVSVNVNPIMIKNRREILCVCYKKMSCEEIQNEIEYFYLKDGELKTEKMIGYVRPYVSIFINQEVYRPIGRSVNTAPFEKGIHNDEDLKHFEDWLIGNGAEFPHLELCSMGDSV